MKPSGVELRGYSECPTRGLDDGEIAGKGSLLVKVCQLRIPFNSPDVGQMKSLCTQASLLGKVFIVGNFTSGF